MRAVAVFTVIMAHGSSPLRGVPGDLGVSAFFVLSGFLITRLLLREREETGDVSITRFYVRRTMRIFPAYYVFLFLSYFLDARAGQQWSQPLLTNAVTYTVNYFNALHHHPTTSIAHAWSLAVEEQFYLLWPVVFVVLAARGRRALVVGVTSMALAAAVWRSWLALATSTDVSYLYNAFDTRFDNLAVGCLLALVIDYDSVIGVAAFVARRSWSPFVTLALLLVSRLALPHSYHYSLGFTIDALLVAVLITQLMQLHKTRVWRWLEWPSVRYLGAISYPMYLYHQWGASFGRHLPLLGESSEFAAGVVMTVVLASGSYYIVERPFLKLKARYAPEKRAKTFPDQATEPAVAGLVSA